MSWFPFDEQQCHLKFGSWTYPNTSINVDITDSYISDKSANYSFRYEQRNQTEHRNKTFEDWYSIVTGYEKNGVSIPVFNENFMFRKLYWLHLKINNYHLEYFYFRNGNY